MSPRTIENAVFVKGSLTFVQQFSNAKSIDERRVHYTFTSVRSLLDGKYEKLHFTVDV